MRTQVIYIKLRDWLIPALQPHWSISTNQCMYSISPANLVCCFVNNRLLGSTVDIPLDHVYKVRVDSYLIYSVQPALWRCVCNHHLCLPWFYWRCCVRALMHSGAIQDQTIAILDVCVNQIFQLSYRNSYDNYAIYIAADRRGKLFCRVMSISEDQVKSNWSSLFFCWFAFRKFPY